MSNFILHTDHLQTETPVSNIFLDEYMPAANGAYVKIYLYLLRCIKSGQDMLSIPAIADRFEHTEKDVLRALAYWEKVQLLRLEYNPDKSLNGICLLEPKHSIKAGAQTVSQEGGQRISQASVSTPPAHKTTGPRSDALLSAEQTPQTDVTGTETGDKCQPKRRPLFPQTDVTGTETGTAAPPKADYSPDQLARFQEQQEIRQLLFISEQYLGKTLSPSEIATILYFYDGLRFSADLIEYLIEYCVSRNHKSLRYIESVALAWHQAGYQTVSQAKRESAIHSKAYYAVLKAFGIKGRSPVDAEVHFIDKWLKDWSFSLELILEACSRTMGAIHQPSFEYADSILKSWRTSKVQSLTDVKALDELRNKNVSKANQESAAAPKKAGAAPNRFHNFKQRDYNFAELEKKLINQ